MDSNDALGGYGTVGGTGTLNSTEGKTPMSTGGKTPITPSQGISPSSESENAPESEATNMPASENTEENATNTKENTASVVTSENDERTADPYGNGWLANRYSRLALGFLIVAVILLVFQISFGKAGTLADILTRATGFSWSFLDFLGGCSEVSALVALGFTCLGLHQKKTRTGVILLVVELIVFVFPLVLALVMAKVMGGTISWMGGTIHL